MLVQATILSAVKPRSAENGTSAAGTGAAAVAQVQPGAPKSDAQAVQSPSAQDTKDLEQTVQGAQEAVEAAGANLQFTIDKDSGKTIVKVVDSQTSEVIRQIPSEELLALARTMSKTEGMLISQKA